VSNTQFAFIDKKDIPKGPRFQELIREMGYDLQLDGDFDFLEGEGFQPCTLNGWPEVGVEIFSEPAGDVTDGDEEFEKLAAGKDYCISMSWGGSYKDCACALIFSHVLMAQCGARTTYEGEELDSLEGLKGGVAEVLELASKGS